MNLKPRRADEPEVSLVALIDVVLMLVIFFMLSSTFVEEGRLRISLPQSSAPSVAPPAGERLVVAITASGGYRVNDRELVNASPETLRAALIRVAGDDRRIPVIVRADGQATHQSVVTAMDVLGGLGFGDIDIATVARPDDGSPRAGAAAGGR